MNKWEIDPEMHYPLALLAGCLLIALAGVVIAVTGMNGPTKSPFSQAGDVISSVKERTLDAAAGGISGLGGKERLSKKSEGIEEGPWITPGAFFISSELDYSFSRFRDQVTLRDFCQ